MVDTQIVARGVKDPRVLDAMREVPRHLFVPPGSGTEAYDDRPIPIGSGQTISQPYMVAIMTELLHVSPEDRVLEIGTGSGYQAAILSRLASHVLSIERHASLADRARDTFAALGFTNIEVVVGDGTEGYPSRAPFERILVTAGAPSTPETLKQQLAVGGRLVIPVGPGGFQHLVLVDRTLSGFTEALGEGCVFVPLVGRHGWPAKA